MDEQSLLSDATTKIRSGELSDSNSSSPHHLPIDHSTHNGTASSSKYKGVVSQVNGHWGAQIYANHQRIWLGTFKSEKEAAMAYDSAAIRLRNGHSHRNFPWTNITILEPNFQSQFSTEAVLGMIRDGSYSARFSDFLKVQDCQGQHFPGLQRSPSGTMLRQLFQKELTPSDVGKLNRLVIPKRYAIKYFSGVPDITKKYNKDSYDLELIFFDRLMRSWKFRYCYWKSSQSFVFTRGWNGFTKEKGLRPRDRVIFSSYECSNQKICIIDVAYHDVTRSGGVIMDNGGGHEAKESGFKDNENVEVERMEPQDDIEEKLNDTGEDVYGELKVHVTRNKDRGFKLFGVQIA